MPISEGSHLLAYDADNNPQYEGWSVRVGGDKSEAVWKIKRYTWTSGNMVEEAWADGNQLYDNIWDNRAILTYVIAVV